MVKYCGYYITFQEVPNEVSLTFTISNCPYRCEDCHSPWLQKNIGDELTTETIMLLLDKYQGAVTCVCFMGDGHELYGFPDYFKEGSYIKRLGGLDSPSTNQHMWKMCEDGKYHDITSWFWRKKE